ncbi:MAG: CCA tRNA nucleotidyltransferase [Acidobacteriota bacterium]|nr:CCA tRNA nucleotidyltransferase [Acidobacteriota bacterium]
MTPRELANSICDALIRTGHQAFLVGGCVRDLLLGREPADYDVSTDAAPDQVMALFPQSVAVGAQFGVIVVPDAEKKVEVATFRSDIGSADGRHPERVVFSLSPEQDVQRRDFTINGLMMRHNSGEILDFVGGQADLRAGIIRAIGEPSRRFAEDKLRMPRAVRFSARFAFPIDTATSEAIRLHAPEIDQVSVERIREELTRMLTEGAANRAFELLHETGLLKLLLPEVAAMKGVEQPPQYHPEGDVWTHTMLMLEGLEAGSPATLAWGILLHDVGKPPTFRPVSETGDRIRFDGHVDVGVRLAQTICRRLRFSNEDTDQIIALIANHMRFIDVRKMRPSTLKRFIRQPRFDEHLALHKLDCLSSHRRLDAFDFVRRTLDETPPEEIRPPRWLTGIDLQQLGYSPGPLFNQILRSLEDAQLEGLIKSKKDAIVYVQEHFGDRKLKSAEFSDRS